MPETERLRILQVVAGPIETNLFIVVEKASGEIMIVDAPPDSLAHVEAEVDRFEAMPAMLLITHTHWDHIGDAAGFKERYGLSVVAHELAKPRLEDPPQEGIAPVAVDRLIGEGDRLALGTVEFEVLHTPGHSGDQISIYAAQERVLLGGDTLFPGGYGRVDIPGASKVATVKTITRLLDLPDDVVVYPGHGMLTTIGRERPWMERVAASGTLPG